MGTVNRKHYFNEVKVGINLGVGVGFLRGGGGDKDMVHSILKLDSIMVQYRLMV